MIAENKLIAEFMGWKIDNSFPDKDTVYRLDNKIETKSMFKFSTSWDHLIPVVNKIKTMVDSSGTNHPNGSPPYLAIESGLQNLDIEKTFRAVAEFIVLLNKRQAEATPSKILN